MAGPVVAIQFRYLTAQESQDCENNNHNLAVPCPEGEAAPAQLSQAPCRTSLQSREAPWLRTYADIRSHLLASRAWHACRGPYAHEATEACACSPVPGGGASPSAWNPPPPVFCGGCMHAAFQNLRRDVMVRMPVPGILQQVDWNPRHIRHRGHRPAGGRRDEMKNAGSAILPLERATRD